MHYDHIAVDGVGKHPVPELHGIDLLRPTRGALVDAKHATAGGSLTVIEDRIGNRLRRGGLGRAVARLCRSL